ncbi:hypothetical protein B7C42_03127 [Nocardia cerradoensis]|uniref:Tetracyclin repressor-like C-terminal domain-containing protein n=1 Tax=Nocardia cerradoensis TaxID=85688 RepID=A0A231H8I8_9NOCA|nr:hypothetical protein B7C42_03127 [Nocardia cerradoensis]
MQAMVRSAFTNANAAETLHEFLSARVLGKLTDGLESDRPDLRTTLASAQLLARQLYFVVLRSG